MDGRGKIRSISATASMFWYYHYLVSRIYLNLIPSFLSVLHPATKTYLEKNTTVVDESLQALVKIVQVKIPGTIVPNYELNQQMEFVTNCVEAPVINLKKCCSPPDIPAHSDQWSFCRSIVSTVSSSERCIPLDVYAAIVTKAWHTKKNAENYLETINTDFNAYMASHPEFILKRVKRSTPQPNQLLPAVKLLFDQHGPLPCAKTGFPLFDKEFMRISKNVLRSIELGHVSDLIDGPPCTEKLITQCINMMILDVGHRPVKNHSLHHIEKLPADFFGQYVETFGIIELEHPFIDAYNMQPGESDELSQQRRSTNAIKTKMLELSFLPIINFGKEGYLARNFLYRYLAQRQHTLYAVVPIHTKEEVLLYKKLLIDKKKERSFNGDSVTPDFEIFAKIWSAFADGKEIYYKTPEHIKIYFNKRTEASVFNDSIALNQNIFQSIRNVLGRPERMPESVAMLSFNTEFISSALISCTTAIHQPNNRKSCH
ncbi:hypothetical protein INT47_009289 [Mucor saturninus]|uniref:Uncharacterized protein n=1 Tax=Mucor saturninus TaxID=64648 RepID=A0A8H7QIW1_9FUNG|nr:hypothetical protein INT47_009289 [Mucor saturninus]